MPKGEIQNAVIRSARIGDVGRGGYLDFSISLDYGGTVQGFGGWGLYLPKSFNHHKIESFAGHFIWRILEIAGVKEWSELEGRALRVDSDHSQVYGIGHIVNDDWFYPQSDIEAARQKGGDDAPTSDPFDDVKVSEQQPQVIKFTTSPFYASSHRNLKGEQALVVSIPNELREGIDCAIDYRVTMVKA